MSELFYSYILSRVSSNIDRVLSFGKTTRDLDSHRIDILSNMFELCSINLFCSDGNGKNINSDDLSQLDDAESIIMINDNIYLENILSLKPDDVKYYIRLCTELGRLYSGDLTTNNETLDQFHELVTKKSHSVINRLKMQDFDNTIDHHVLKNTLNLDNIQQMNMKYSEFLNILNIKKNLFTKIPETTGEFDCPVNKEIQQFDQTHSWIVKKSSELKDLMSLCNFHAAETYLTQGAFFLIVAVMGKEQKIGVTFDETFDCTMENIGDTIKECSSYIMRQKKDQFRSLNTKGDVKILQTIYITDRLLIKTSKYLMRMYSSQKKSYEMILNKMLNHMQDLTQDEANGIEKIKYQISELSKLITKTETIRSRLRGKSEDLVDEFAKTNVSREYTKLLRGTLKEAVLYMKNDRGTQIPTLHINSQTRQQIEKLNSYLAKQQEIDLDVDDTVLDINKYLADNMYDIIFDKREVNVEAVFRYSIDFFFKNIPMMYGKDSDPSHTYIIKFLHNVWFDMEKYTEDIDAVINRKQLVPDFRMICSSMRN